MDLTLLAGRDLENKIICRQKTSVEPRPLDPSRACLTLAGLCLTIV